MIPTLYKTIFLTQLWSNHLRKNYQTVITSYFVQFSFTSPTISVPLRSGEKYIFTMKTITWIRLQDLEGSEYLSSTICSVQRVVIFLKTFQSSSCLFLPATIYYFLHIAFLLWVSAFLNNSVLFKVCTLTDNTQI